MIRTFALAALIAAPNLALAQIQFAPETAPVATAPVATAPEATVPEATVPGATAPAQSTDAPEEARQGSPFEMLPAPPPPSRVAFSAPTSRSLLDRPARPDAPNSFLGLQYEAGLKRGAREADLMEGPLNGQWRLVDATGRQLYAFQLTSSASRGEPPSGAWRNLNVAKSPTSAGFIALLGYDGARLDMRFTERSAGDLVIVSVNADPTGRYAGNLTKDGVTTPVRLERQP